MKKEASSLLGRYRYASLWKRLFAYLIDILLLNFVIILPFKSILKPLQNEKVIEIGKFIDLNILLALLSITLLSYIYFVYLDYKLQKTIGMIVFGLISKTKGEFTLQKILLRNITKPFSILLIFDALYMIYKGGYQRYTEVISDTWTENG